MAVGLKRRLARNMPAEDVKNFWGLVGHSWGLNGWCLDSHFATVGKSPTEQSFFLIPPSSGSVPCAIENFLQVDRSRPCCSTIQSLDKKLDGSGNYRAGTCRISNIVKCFMPRGRNARNGHRSARNNSFFAKFSGPFRKYANIYQQYLTMIKYVG